MDLKFKVKKPKRVAKQKRYKNTPANKLKHQMTWIKKKYDTGDLDLNKKSHYITTLLAIQKGVLPKEVLTDGRYYQTDGDES